jgi:hypothetical protein
VLVLASVLVRASVPARVRPRADQPRRV